MFDPAVSDFSKSDSVIDFLNSLDGSSIIAAANRIARPFFGKSEQGRQASGKSQLLTAVYSRETRRVA